MNNLDETYQILLTDILEHGVTKEDRTGTGTLSVFGRQIRHKMSDGFPLLTTKKMAWKQIVTELLWFLRGDTNIQSLLKDGNNIWVGDAYKKYQGNQLKGKNVDKVLSKEEFINKIKTDDEFAKMWGELGPIYGKQWRDWGSGIDQIQNLINDLNNNPDSRRMVVNAWNVSDIDKMTLPPCHYGFQVYTRELSTQERWDYYRNGAHGRPIKMVNFIINRDEKDNSHIRVWLDRYADFAPTRAISLMWNQRSVDTFLGLPFNIASYGLLLEILAKMVNMVPEELIGNLGDTHLYSNHIDAATELLSRKNKYKLPKLDIKLHMLNVPSFKPEWWVYDDFEIQGYESYPSIKAKLSN